MHPGVRDALAEPNVVAVGMKGKGEVEYCPKGKSVCPNYLWCQRSFCGKNAQWLHIAAREAASG